MVSEKPMRLRNRMQCEAAVEHTKEAASKHATCPAWCMPCCARRACCRLPAGHAAPAPATSSSHQVVHSRAVEVDSELAGGAIQRLIHPHNNRLVGRACKQGSRWEPVLQRMRRISWKGAQQGRGGQRHAGTTAGVTCTNAAGMVRALLTNGIRCAAARGGAGVERRVAVHGLHPHRVEAFGRHSVSSEGGCGVDPGRHGNGPAAEHHVAGGVVGKVGAKLVDLVQKAAGRVCAGASGGCAGVKRPASCTGLCLWAAGSRPWHTCSAAHSRGSPG